MEQKIFEDFPKVDCNDCGHYWDSSCDGVAKGSVRPCKDFLATRKVLMPEEIARLRKQIKALTRSTAIIALSLLLHYLSLIFRW